MAYTPATQLPLLNVFQWATPDAPNPRLAAPIVSTNTSLTFTSPPLDNAGAVITGHFLMGIKNAAGYTETVYVPAAAMSVDGLTATGVVRGVRLEGLDYTTGDTDLAADFGQDSPVYCNISAVNFSMMVGAMQGTLGSGGANWRIGRAIDEDITVFAYNADASKPFFQYDAGTSGWIYSNDGVSSTPFGTGAGVTGGAGITVAAGVIDVDLTDTTVFVSTSSGAGDSGKVARLGASGTLAVGFLATGTANNTKYLRGDGTWQDSSGIVPSDSLSKTLLTAKGALITATAANTPATQTVGSNEQVLTSDSAQANGIKWGAKFETKNGVTTRAGDTASGSQVIAHGLGRVPLETEIRVTYHQNASDDGMISTGIYNGTTTSTVYLGIGASEGAGNSATNVAEIYYNSTTTNSQKATISVDATNITLTWTKAGTPNSADMNIQWIVRG